MSSPDKGAWKGLCREIQGPDTSSPRSVLVFSDENGREVVDNPNVVIDSSGRVGIGTGSPAVDLDVVGEIAGSQGLVLTEQSTAPTPLAGRGRFWVRDDSPNVPVFTSDDASDHRIQYHSPSLDVLGGLSPADGNVVVGAGSSWVVESGATARASLGLTIGANVQAWDVNLDQIAGQAPSSGGILVGSGTAWATQTGATARASLGAQAADPNLDELASMATAGIVRWTGTNFVSQTGTASRLATWSSTSSLGVGAIAIGSDGGLVLPTARTIYWGSDGSAEYIRGIVSDVVVHAGNDLHLQAGADLEVTVSGNVNLNSNSNVNLNPTGNVNLSPTGNVNLSPTGNVNLQAANIYLGAGTYPGRYDATNGSLMVGATSAPGPKTKIYAINGSNVGDAVGEFRRSGSDANKLIIHLRFNGDSTVDANDDWIRFSNLDGEVGRIHSEVTYGNFTGGHESQATHEFVVDRPSVEQPDGTFAPTRNPRYFEQRTGAARQEWLPGMIVRSTGAVLVSRMSRALPAVELAAKVNDPAVMGVFVGARESHEMANFDRTKPAIWYNAIGEGQIRITDLNGPIQNGDLVTSSAIPGHGQRQDDDLFHSYTVAKCTQDVDWEAVVDVVEHEGRSVKWALVACTYHCG